MALFPAEKVWQSQGSEMRERGGKRQIKPVWAIPPKLEREGSRESVLHKEQTFAKGYDTPAFLSPGCFWSNNCGRLIE